MKIALVAQQVIALSSDGQFGDTRLLELGRSLAARATG